MLSGGGDETVGVVSRCQTFWSISELKVNKLELKTALSITLGSGVNQRNLHLEQKWKLSCHLVTVQLNIEHKLVVLCTVSPRSF